MPHGNGEGTESASELPGLLVCQETLQPLRLTAEGLWSEAASRLYPVAGDLVFMGFPQRDEAMITATMNEEHEWQGTVASLERDAEFLRHSAPAAVELINLLGDHMAPPARVLELGSGSGWVSWLLARAGYDTYLCDFEANSLALGLEFDHPMMGLGRRIVADARYAPFPSGSFDVVLFKEFVHHVEDYRMLFREANRLLRPGGLVVLMEPTMSVPKWVYERRHPDPHAGHRITWPERYLRSLSRLGFRAVHVGAFHSDHEPGNAALRMAKRYVRRRTNDGAKTDLIGRIYLSVCGGAQLVAIAQKTLTVPEAARPSMALIGTDTMTTTSADRERYAQLRPIVDRAADGLTAATR